MQTMFVRVALVIGLSTGCAGDGTGVDLGGTVPGAVTLSGDVQPIFTANCALSGCHAAPDPQQGQNLSAGQAFANIVNVPANERPGMNRITPNDPENSYLVHKIQGTHVQVGGMGARMPLGGTALDQSEIDIIRSWVQNGAPNN